MLKESPTGGDEQAAANPIAHATNDDWRKEGGGKRGQGAGGSHLKAQVGSSSEIVAWCASERGSGEGMER